MNEKLDAEEVRRIVEPDVKEGMLTTRKMGEVGIAVTDETLELGDKSCQKEVSAVDNVTEPVNDTALGENTEGVLGDSHVSENIAIEYSGTKSQLLHLDPTKSCCLVPDSVSNDHVLDSEEPNTIANETVREMPTHLCKLATIYHDNKDQSDPKNDNMEGKIDENLPAFSLYRNIDASSMSYKTHQCHRPVDPVMLITSTDYELENTNSDLKDPELENFQTDMSSIELKATVVDIASPLPHQSQQSGNNNIVKKLDHSKFAETNDDSNLSLVKLDDAKTNFVFVEEVSCFDISQVTPESAIEGASSQHENSAMYATDDEATQVENNVYSNISLVKLHDDKTGSVFVEEVSCLDISQEVSPENAIEVASLHEVANISAEDGESTQAIKTDDVSSNNSQEEKDIETFIIGCYDHGDENDDQNTHKVVKPENQNGLHEEINLAYICLEPTDVELHQELSVALLSDENGYINCKMTLTKDANEFIQSGDLGNCTHSLVSTNIGPVDLFEVKPKAHENAGGKDHNCDDISDKSCPENMSEFNEINKSVSCMENEFDHFSETKADSLEVSVQCVDQINTIHIITKPEAQVVNASRETSASKQLSEELDTKMIDEDETNSSQIEPPMPDGNVNLSMKNEVQDSGSSEGPTTDYLGEASIICNQLSGEEINCLEERSSPVILPDLDVQTLDCGIVEKSDNRHSQDVSTILHQGFEEGMNIFLSERQKSHVTHANPNFSVDACSATRVECHSDSSSGCADVPLHAEDLVCSLTDMPVEPSNRDGDTKASSSVPITKDSQGTVTSIFSIGGVSSTEIEPETKAERCTSEDNDPSLSAASRSEQGRRVKENDESVMDPSSWSTSEAPHFPLKNLLNLASSKADAAAPYRSMSTAKIPTSMTSPAPPIAAGGGRRIVYEEWNSPARLPLRTSKNGKSSKPRGKSQWVPFMCCSYVNELKDDARRSSQGRH